MSQVALKIQLNPTIDTQALKQVFASLQQALANGQGGFNPIDSKRLQQELSNASKSVEQFEQQFEGTKKQIEEVNKELEKSPEIANNFNKAFQFNQVTDVVTKLASSLSSLSAPFAELDTQVKNIGTLGTKNFEEFAQLSLDLSKKIPDNAATIAGAAYNAISAGIQGTNQEIISFVETAGKVAVAGVSDTNSAVNGLTSVLNAYKLTASDANTVSDTFFAAIKLGKTSFNEINAGLANVVPAASAAGVSFQEVSGFIAQMTALGVPTAQATTQIRAALIEVQKPGSELANVMKNVTVEIDGTKQALTSANIGQVLKQQGLATTLQQIEQASGAMGKSLTQVFSSSEAASAALLVTGDNAERMNNVLSQVATEVENGAATGAYEVAAQGIEARTKVFLNNIQAGFSTFFSTFGEGVNVAIGATAQLAPVLATLTGLQTIIPDGAVGNLKNFAVTLLNNVVPGLIATNATTGALTINTNALSVANVAASVKAKAFAAAQLLINAVMSANPIGLVVAGLVALGVAFVAAYKYSETFRNGVDAVFKFITEQAEKFLGYLKAFGAGISALFKGENPLKAMSDSVNTTELEKKLETSLKTIEDGTKKDLKFKADIEKADSFDKKIKDLEETEAKIKIITESDNRTPEQEKELERLREKSQNLANAIGSVAKTAVTETKGAIDANGKYTEQLSINVEKAKEFAKAQQEGLSKDLVKNQTDVSNALIQQSKVYEEQKQKLDEIAKKAVELKNAGKNDEYEKQVKQMEEFGKEVDTNKTKLIANFQSAVQGGTANDKAQKEVGKTLNLNSEQIKLMANQQKDVTKEVEKTGAAAKSLADQFNETLNAQKKQFEQGIKEESQLRLTLKTRKDLSKEERAELQNKLRETIKLNNETNKQLKTTEQAEKDAKKRFEETKQTEKKTALELFKLSQDERKIQLDDLILSRQRTIAEQNRKSNALDQLQIEKDRNKFIQADLRDLQERLQIQSDGSIGLKLKKEDKEKLQAEYDKEFNRLRQDLEKSNIAVINLETDVRKIDFDKLNRSLSQQVKNYESQLKKTFGLGGESWEGFRELLQKQLEPIEFLYQDLQRQVNELDLVPDKSESQLAQYAEYSDKLIEITEQRVAVLDKIQEVEIKVNNEKLKEKLDLLAIEEKAIKEANERESKLLTDIVNKSKTTTISLLTTAKEREIAKLEELYKTQEELEKGRTDSAKKQFDALAAAFDKGRLSEEAYYRQSAELSAKQSLQEQEALNKKRDFENEKLRIEKEAQVKELIANALANGQLLQLERNKQIEELDLQKQKLELQAKVARNSNDVEGYKKIQQQLTDLNNEIADKGDIITAYATNLQGDITNTLSNLFNGDTEQAKEGFRGVFGVIAGALKAQAGATATQLVLAQVGLTGATTGFAGLLLVPAITALVNAAIGKLLDPVLSGLLSFSTGGRVDSPTIAMIGDASKSRAGADSEWVFRDDQINLLLYRVAGEFNKSIVTLYSNLRDDSNFLANLMKENIELSRFAITPDGNVIDTQSEMLNLALAQVLNTSISELDNKFNVLTEYQNKLNMQNKDVVIDYNIFRQDFALLKSELLQKDSNQTQLSNDLLNINNIINNDNVISSIEEMKSEVVNRIDITNHKLDVLNDTVSNLQLSISQNDIYKANKTVEINRNSRARV